MNRHLRPLEMVVVGRWVRVWVRVIVSRSERKTTPTGTFKCLETSVRKRPHSINYASNAVQRSRGTLPFESAYTYLGTYAPAFAFALAITYRETAFYCRISITFVRVHFPPRNLKSNAESNKKLSARWLLPPYLQVLSLSNNLVTRTRFISITESISEG